MRTYSAKCSDNKTKKIIVKATPVKTFRSPVPSPALISLSDSSKWNPRPWLFPAASTNIEPTKRIGNLWTAQKFIVINKKNNRKFKEDAIKAFELTSKKYKNYWIYLTENNKN